MMRWSIATVCMGGGLESKLKAAAKAGFRVIELFENDLTFFSGGPRDVRRMASDLGLEITALQPLRDFEGAPDNQRQRQFDRALRKLELTADLGAPLLCVCSSVAENAIGDADRIAGDLADLADHARQFGLRIGYEALSWGRHVKDWPAAWELVARADRANLGIVLDSFHACVRGNPIAPIAALPGDKIALAQVADAPALQMDPLSLSRHYRCYPGQGDYPLIEFVDAVARSGYRGALSLEIFNEQFRGASASEIAVDGMRSLLALGETLNGRREAKGEAPDFAPLPPSPRVAGTEFLEFAVSDKDAGDLAALLHGLGFAHAGRHRSKTVDLYAQGDVNLILNRQRDSFANAFQLLHGPSICAITLKVDSVERALERAQAMQASPHVGRIGPGEASIYGLRGVEGTLIYVVDERGPDWRADFVAREEASVGNLRAIDHLSNVVRRGEVLSWSLFYQTTLGLNPEPQVEVADPHGAFYSRSLRGPENSLRIALNAGDGGQTGVARFLEASGGAGYQQIALLTDDIFAHVEAARANGVSFLPIPQNYYDDLATRFDIAPERLESMRELGVLYDRVGDGEFLHIYTRAFRRRFFFEIVQRRNYDLFGAANTPVRLAAQDSLDDAEMQLAADAGR